MFAATGFGIRKSAAAAIAVNPLHWGHAGCGLPGHPDTSTLMPFSNPESLGYRRANCSRKPARVLLKSARRWRS